MVHTGLFRITNLENIYVNPLVTNHLNESTIILWASDFISFFDENHVSIQNSPRWDAAFCGVISGAIMFAYVS